MRLLIPAFFALSLVAHAQDIHSPKRAPGQRWQDALARYKEQTHTSGQKGDDLASDLAVDPADLKPESIPAWPNAEKVREYFSKARDERFLSWERDPKFPRRSSWLYPDDGCYARAALAVRNSEKWAYPALDKIFVYGDLRAKTANAPGGEVVWWYHVAPVAAVDGQVYVIDPSLSTQGPLLLNDWLALMGDPKSMKVAVCRARAYTPASPCLTPSEEEVARAQEDLQYFLNDEWDRILALGREPQAELGESPPWRQQ